MLIIKAILIVLLLLCLLPMPYEYYIIVRWAATISMVVFAFKDNEEKNFLKYVVYVLIGGLFNPFIIIELPRLAWNIIDVILAIILSTSAIKTYKEEYS